MCFCVVRVFVCVLDMCVCSELLCGLFVCMCVCVCGCVFFRLGVCVFLVCLCVMFVWFLGCLIVVFVFMCPCVFFCDFVFLCV